MQIGFIGLGRMGANMVRRLLHHGQECVVYNRSPEKVNQLTAEGATGVSSLDELVERLNPPRAIWLMVPAGDPTEQMVEQLAQRLEPGDILIDGGNSYYVDDLRHAKTVAVGGAAPRGNRGIHYLDVGTSGGVWGRERGYCMMIGGVEAAVKHLDPVFKALAPGVGTITSRRGCANDRTPGRDKVATRRKKAISTVAPAAQGTSSKWYITASSMAMRMQFGGHAEQHAEIIKS